MSFVFMATRNPERPVQLSVLDRLIDRDPANRREAPLTRAQSVRELKAALRRDLEWLLNTRQTIQHPDAEDADALLLTQSVYEYGVPDFTGLTLDSGKHRQRLTRMLEDAVANFEPRLQGIRITPRESERDRRTLRFVIEGMLQIEPSPELVSFDTFVELGSGEFRVKGE